MHFEWAPQKASANLKKHHVSFAEAATCFDDPLGVYYPDKSHDDRFVLIGFSIEQQLLYVVHAEVDEDTIRIISARRATKNEKTHYEND